MEFWRSGFAALLTFALAVAPAWAGVQKSGPPGAGEGSVYFQHSVNFPRGTNGPNHASVIAVEREDRSGPTYFLDSSVHGLQATFAYAGVLPAGRYRFRDFASAVCYVLCGKPLSPPPEDMPAFEVHEGSIAYLGTLVVSRTATLEGKTRETHVDWGWHDSPDPAAGVLLIRRSHPALAELPVTVGWTRDEPAATQRLNDIRLESAAMILSGRDGDDGFWFGSLNGVVKRWRPGDAEVTVYDTGTDFMISSVAPTTDGTLLAAAGEGGTLRYSDDDGRTWKDGNIGLPFGIVSNLVAIGDREFALTVALKDQVEVYRGTPGESWRQVAAFPMKFATWTGLVGVQPQTFLYGESLVLTLPSRKFAVMDLATGKNEVLDPPGSIGAFKVAADGALWCTCAKTIAFSPWVSRDLGRTWTRADFSRFMVLPEFADAQRGFSYQGAILNADKTGLATTEDGGLTWTMRPLPDVDIAWWQPAYSRDGKVMVLHSLRSLDGLAMQMTRYSMDGGDTWAYAPRQVKWAYPLQ